MKADRHTELLDRLPQRFEVCVVNVPAVDRIRIADDGDGTELAYRALGFLRCELNVLIGELSRKFQALGVGCAEIAGPVIVGACERIGESRLEIVVHLHVSSPGTEQDRYVDTLDVHRLKLRPGIVAGGRSSGVVRMPWRAFPVRLPARRRRRSAG